MGERYRLFMKMVEYYDHLHLVPAIQIETYSGEFCIRLTRKCENSQMTSKCFICGYVTHSVRFSFILCPVYAIPILCSEYRDTHTNLCFITYSWNALSLNTLECVCVCVIRTKRNWIWHTANVCVTVSFHRSACHLASNKCVLYFFSPSK